MNILDAIKLQKEIEVICNKFDIWYKIVHDKRPELKTITMEISIRVDSDKLK